MLVEVFVNSKSVNLIFIRPSALVVTKREVLRHSAVTKDVGHASEMGSVGVAYENVAFEVSSFTEPEGIGVTGSVLVDIDVGVRGVLPVHTDKGRGLLATGDDNWHGSVERALASDGITGEILIVEIVRDVSLGVFKEKASSSFSETIKGIGGEGKIGGNVFVKLKALLSIYFEHDFFSGAGSG